MEEASVVDAYRLLKTKIEKEPFFDNTRSSSAQFEA